MYLRNGKKQDEIAKKIGQSRQAVSRIERGNPSLSTIKKYADACSFDIVAIQKCDKDKFEAFAETINSIITEI